MIKLYIYQKSNGGYLYSDTGSADGVIHNLGTDKDFTLEPLPDHDHQWYWYNNQWNTQPTE